MPGKRSRTCSFRASDEDRAALEKIAASQDVTLGKLLYRTACQHLPPPVRAGAVPPTAGPASPPAPGEARTPWAPVPASTPAPAPRVVALTVYHVDDIEADPLRTETGATKR